MMKQMSAVMNSVLMLLLTSVSVFSQSFASKNVMNLDKPENKPRATIADVAWLAGAWKVEGLGGTADEYYTEPQAGNMAGVFRLIKDGKVVFYEIVIIQEQEGSLVMKLKHFDPSLVGWEERTETVDFPLVRVSDREINFSGITMRKKDDRCMEVFVLIGSKDGEAKEQPFLYCRK